MGSDAFCLPAAGFANQGGRSKASRFALENLVLGESSVLCNGSLPEDAYVLVYSF